MKRLSLLIMTVLSAATAQAADPIPISMGDTHSGVLRPNPTNCAYAKTSETLALTLAETISARVRFDTDGRFGETKTWRGMTYDQTTAADYLEISAKTTRTVIGPNRKPRTLTEIVPVFKSRHPHIDNLIELPAGTLTLKISSVGCEPSAYSLNLAEVVEQGRLEGIISDPSGAPIPGAVVAIYTPDGAFVDTGLTDATGAYAIDLAPGRYFLRANAAIYAPGKPFQGASEIAVTATGTTRNLTLGPQPVLSSASTLAFASGETMSLYGLGFGSSKDYLDLGGYLTNSSSYIQSWTDTQIDLKVPGSAIPGCWRVFSTQGGYSDCLMLSHS